MNLAQNFLKEVQQNYPYSMGVLKLIGFLIVLRKLFKLLRGIYKVCIRRRLNLSKRYGAKSWAFVTGSSEGNFFLHLGIGKAIALSLAKEGFNIILSARTLKKLETAKQEILQKYPSVQVQVFSIDFKRSDEVGYIQGFLEKVKDLDISILVNNVGVDVLDFYKDLPVQQIVDLVKINCFPVTVLSRLFIPQFLQRTKKTSKKCAIVNVSSVAGQIPMTLYNVYSASKVYVDYLSRILSQQHKELDIMSLKPSEVSTPMTSNREVNLMTLSAENCAQGMLDNLGYEVSTNGHWNHQVQRWLYMAVPQCLFNYIWFNFAGPDFMKERAQAKKKEQKKEN